jgi:hypothetical protein
MICFAQQKKILKGQARLSTDCVDYLNDWKILLDDLINLLTRKGKHVTPAFAGMATP